MKNEEGFALIIVLMIAVFIGILLTAAITATNTFRQHNQRAKKQIEQKVEKFNSAK